MKFNCICDTGSSGDVLDDDPVGRLKVFVYEIPSLYNEKRVERSPRCLTHMFAAEIFMHRFLLSSPVRTLNPEEADWFYTSVYTTCDLNEVEMPMMFNAPRLMRSVIKLISSTWPYWNRTEGADHFFVVPHDFGACFEYQVSVRLQLSMKLIVISHEANIGEMMLKYQLYATTVYSIFFAFQHNLHIHIKVNNKLLVFHNFHNNYELLETLNKNS